jgi:serine/threonine protein kinase
MQYIAQTYLVSEPGQYVLERSLYNMDEDTGTHFMVRVGTPVRVMLMERLGEPLKEIPAEIVGRQLKSIAKQGLEILRAVHEIGFVHGDVHDGNFVLSNTVGGSVSASADGEPTRTIKAIDFGQSMRFVESSEKGDYPIGQKSVKFLSTSELEEKFPAPKDDLFRWGETLMNTVTKGKYFSDLEFEIIRCTGEETITKTLEWKSKSPIHDPSNRNEALIAEFMAVVRSLPYNAKPGVAAYDVLASFFD